MPESVKVRNLLAVVLPRLKQSDLLIRLALPKGRSDLTTVFEESYIDGPRSTGCSEPFFARSNKYIVFEFGSLDQEVRKHGLNLTQAFTRSSSERIALLLHYSRGKSLLSSAQERQADRLLREYTYRHIQVTKNELANPMPGVTHLISVAAVGMARIYQRV
jgi:hypothetical protein